MDKNISRNFSKVRRIGPGYSNDRGTLFTDKNLLDECVEFESLTEECLFLLLDHDPNCTNIESQPIEIKNESGKGNPYVPDAWASFQDGTEVIFDVKHHTFFNSIKHNPEKALKWKVRKNCIRSYCNEKRLLYQIITSEELYGNRLDNVQLYRKNRKIPSELASIKPILLRILGRKGSLNRIDLANEISNILDIDVKAVIPSIDYGVIFATQSVADVKKEIIDLCNTKIFFQTQGSGINYIKEYFSNKEDLERLKKLPVGQAFITSKGKHEPVEIKFPNIN